MGGIIGGLTLILMTLVLFVMSVVMHTTLLEAVSAVAHETKRMSFPLLKWCQFVRFG